MAIHIIGAGLAGSEAAYFLAEHGQEVILHEMRPQKQTPAHQTGGFAELVCSNSLKSKNPLSAPGMLKAEMMQVGSLILDSARLAEVPAGEALGVDRDQFSAWITEKIRSHPRIKVVEGEVTKPFPNEINLLATGPLTSDPLLQWIEENLPTDSGSKDLYFYDAIAPILDASSIDMDKVFLANRYDKGEEEAYLNCPMSEEQYYAFIDALIAGEKVAPKSFEKEKFFQGCQPIEAIAATGRDSLRFGPMKPVGLEDPKTGKRPYAVVQLRPENRSKTAYNMVGFQTKLKYGEQGRVFRTIPGLEKVEFLRLGSIHRNSYICAPRLLRGDLSFRGRPKVYFAGQITGVEGYLESAATGMLAGLFILQRAQGRPHDAPPANTALGALLRHITGSEPKDYQPSNIHFGLFDPIYFEIQERSKKDEIRSSMAAQTLKKFEHWLAEQTQRPAAGHQDSGSFLDAVRSL